MIHVKLLVYKEKKSFYLDITSHVPIEDQNHKGSDADSDHYLIGNVAIIKYGVPSR